MTGAPPMRGCDEQFRDLMSKDVEIPCGRFTYPCRLKLTPGAQYLSVQFHGDFSRKETALPVFGRWNWGKILGAHVLSFCDPTIYLDDNLSLGWYLGTVEENALHGVVAIAQRCAAEIGIDPERIVFSGSSGGGFAALQAAALLQNGKAIAINAQTDLLHFWHAIVQRYVDLATPYATIAEAKNAFGSRWNAIDALRSARVRGLSPQIVMVNNRNDWHYKKHFLPFAEAFGLGLHQEQSVSGSCMALLYDGPHKHCTEPTEVVKRINNEGIPFLFEGTIVPFTPDFSVHLSSEGGKIVAEIRTAGNYQYACYLFKDNVIIEKRLYASDNRFSFDPAGPGQYKVRGFIRNSAGETLSKFSDPLTVTES